MSSSILFYIAASLILSSLAHAKGGKGSHSSSSSSGSSGPCYDCVTIGTWQVSRKWIIIVGVIVGVVVLIILCALLKKFGCCAWLTRRARLKQETKRRKEEEGEILRQEEWLRNQPRGQRHPYIPITAPWGADSQHTLPYAQGGLGYAHGTGHVIYLPSVENKAPYSIPYDPPSYQHKANQSQISVPSSPPSHYRNDSQAHLNPFLPPGR